jgi:hypothetical protein
MSQIYYQAADGSFKPWVDVNGAALVSQLDANENILGGAFPPSDQGADLTGSAASQAQALPAGTGYVRFDVITADCRIKFGTGAVTVTTTTGSRFRAGTSEVVQVPTGATYFAYIGNTASINWTPA